MTDESVTAQLSPCVGGLVRTWPENGRSQLWSTTDADWLRAVLATGQLGRTPRGEKHARESGLLCEEEGTLVVTHAGEDTVVTLTPSELHDESAAGDFHDVLAQAVAHCVDSGEYVIVELGEPGSPAEPFCLFAVVDEEEGPVGIIETSPDPEGSEFWGPHIIPGRPTQELTAEATSDAISVAPTLMIDAISRWGHEPWDLTFTFGKP